MDEVNPSGLKDKAEINADDSNIIEIRAIVNHKL
jgi:hypothetical protein